MPASPIFTRRSVISVVVITCIITIPLIGFGLMQLLVYFLPISESTVTQGLYMLGLIGLGLALPYWMLKLGVHEAHERNKQEREVKLTDIPKDKDQLEREE